MDRDPHAPLRGDLRHALPALALPGLAGVCGVQALGKQGGNPPASVRIWQCSAFSC